MEGEALACRVLDVNPSGVKFLQPIYLELPHFSALRNGERELVVLRTQDGGWNWDEVCVEDMKGTCNIHGLSVSFYLSRRGGSRVRAWGESGEKRDERRERKGHLRPIPSRRT